MPRLVRSAAPRQTEKTRGGGRAGRGGRWDGPLRVRGAGAREWRALDLAERFEAAASRHREGDDEGALGVFALCLLYGFRGALYADAAQLARIRRACRGLFDRVPELRTPPQRRRGSELLVWGERAAYVALPLLVCILFALYCGGVLANAPFHGKF